MFSLKFSIILQLAGALDALAGVVLCMIAIKGGLASGAILIIIGMTLFVVGRILLRRCLKNRRFPLMTYREAVRKNMLEAQAYPTTEIPVGLKSMPPELKKSKAVVKGHL